MKNLFLFFLCFNFFYSFNIILNNKEQFCLNKNFFVEEKIIFNFQYLNINNSILKTEIFSPIQKIIFSSNKNSDKISLNVNSDGNYKFCFYIKSNKNCKIEFDLKSEEFLTEILNEQNEINKIFKNMSKISSNILQIYNKISLNKDDLIFNNYISNLFNLVNILTLIKIIGTLIISIINIFIIKKIIKNKELQEMLKNFIRNPFDNKKL
jgi:hypothetical protein